MTAATSGRTQYRFFLKRQIKWIISTSSTATTRKYLSMDYQRSKQLQISNQTRLVMYCIFVFFGWNTTGFWPHELTNAITELHFGLLTRNNFFIQVQRPGLIEREKIIGMVRMKILYRGSCYVIHKHCRTFFLLNPGAVQNYRKTSHRYQIWRVSNSTTSKSYSSSTEIVG